MFSLNNRYVSKAAKLSWKSSAPAVMKAGHLLFFALSILILVGRTIGVAQSRSSDKELFQAIAKDDIGAVRVLLANGAALEAKDDRGDTPMIVAVSNQDIAIVKLLLEKGADISAKNSYEETALIEAARSFDPEMLRTLLDGNPDIKDKDAALFQAAENGPVVIHIADAPPSATGQNDRAAMTAPELPWVKNVELLLDSGADIEARDDEGETPLMRAAAFGQSETFKLLLERGAKINVRDRGGLTPLIAAACSCAIATMNSTYDIMKILLEKGANVNARTRDGKTALIMAAGSPDDSASVKLLLNWGADPMAKDNEGKTAMTFAKDNWDPKKVELLKRAIAKTR
ncbi:MAG: ankyrin repeat domain-containing protein [Candidatus Sulfotelmatobacter sp.]